VADILLVLRPQVESEPLVDTQETSQEDLRSSHDRFAFGGLLRVNDHPVSDIQIERAGGGCHKGFDCRIWTGCADVPSFIPDATYRVIDSSGVGPTSQTAE
jgi:hypothetical protein